MLLWCVHIQWYRIAYSHCVYVGGLMKDGRPLLVLRPSNQSSKWRIDAYWAFQGSELEVYNMLSHRFPWYVHFHFPMLLEAFSSFPQHYRPPVTIPWPYPQTPPRRGPRVRTRAWDEWHLSGPGTMAKFCHEDVGDLLGTRCHSTSQCHILQWNAWSLWAQLVNKTWLRIGCMVDILKLVNEC